MDNLFEKTDLKLKLIAGQVYQQAFYFLSKNEYIDLPNN